MSTVEQRIAALEAEIARMKKTLESTVLDVSSREAEPEAPENPPTTAEMEAEVERQTELIRANSKEADEALKQNQIFAREQAQGAAQDMAEGQNEARQAIAALRAGEPLLEAPLPPEPEPTPLTLPEDKPES